MRPVNPRFVVALAAAAVAAGVATFAHAGSLPLPQQTQEPPPPRIRVSVDVVAVDVQVIDRTGRPVPNLGPDKFRVTINGRQRRIVSAEQIVTDTEDSTAISAPGSPSSTVPARVIMLAVDCVSFDATAARDVIQSVAQFVRGLRPDDHVGLYAYPNGAQISPTTDHASVLRALNTVVGQRDGPGLSQFHLRPSDIIDISRDLWMGTGPALEAVSRRECGQAPEPGCQFRLITEVTSTALYYEGQATASLGMLRTLVTQMHSFPGRKTLILVSGGMIASDRPGGRPDLSAMGMQVGREAAAANTAIYTLFIDRTLHDRYAAETRSGDRNSDNRARDSAVLVQWLEQFAGAAGGALFNVQVANATPALTRIRGELASYYLLGVEPAEEDRDGRTHEVAVKINHPNVTIRGRRWVMIPKRGVTARSEPASPAAPTTPAPADPPPRRSAPADVTRLADAFDRGNRDTFLSALSESTDLGSVLQGFRMSDSPWPQNRRRTAVFALELALAGLRSDLRAVRDEGARLLAEYHVLVRQPQGADTFECAWLVTEAAALESLFKPDSALVFVPRSLQRCPTSPRLHLAHAFLLEQQWLGGAAAPAQEAEIVNRYEQAMKFPETDAEARVRVARFLYALGQFDRALTILDGITKPSPDLEIRYFTHMVRGQVLRAAGRLDDAAAAFRAALADWPGAQSAHVALMTLMMARGNRKEAAALADAIQIAPADQYDPWWMYWLGDYRVYSTLIGALRELER